MIGTRGARPLLASLRVLDVTEALAGPFCGAILSDLGAEVIKVERVQGDSMRRRHALGAPSIPFHMVQRNKKSVALDLRTHEGAQVLQDLAATADVFVENFSPGVLQKYGLGYECLAPRNPGLIYCSVSGFGQTGGLREAKGVDLVAQGYGGLMSVTGLPDGEPVKAGYPVSDLGSGMYAAIGILAALESRHETGSGTYLDISLVDTIVSWSVWEAADFQMTGVVPRPLGSAHRLVAPYEAFKCAHGQWVTVAAVDRQWPVFCKVLGIERLADDERFSTEYLRFENRDQLAHVLTERFLKESRDTWIERLRNEGIPCGPVHNMETLINDPFLAERGTWIEMKEGEQSFKLPNTPIHSEGVPGVVSLAPTLGADTRNVLLDAGYAPQRIKDLTESGVVFCGDAESS